MSTEPDHVSELATTVIRDHAREQMLVRAITEDQIRLVLRDPDEVLAVRPGRVVAQRTIATAEAGNQEYLFRAFVDVDRQPPELVTAYRTSKIRKYRSQP